MERYSPSTQFIKTASKLTYREYERIEKALAKFERMPSLPGLHLEKLGGYEDRWSIRVDLSHRIIMTKTQDAKGALWILEDVGPHDIYKQGRR